MLHIFFLSKFSVMCIFILTLIALIHTASSKTTTCDLRSTKHGAICVCTAQYCDYLDDPKPLNNQSFVVISSSKEGLRFSVKNGSFEAKEPLEITDFYGSSSRTSKSEQFIPTALIIEDDGRAFVQLEDDSKTGRFLRPLGTMRATVKIDRKKRYQKIVGFGGAFTGSVSHLLQQLDSVLQDQIYRSFFHETGIKFNMLRMSIGGSDFDLQPWAYNEQPRNDDRLTNFTQLDERDEVKIQQIKRLKDIAKVENLKIMAAAWSAPVWMKSNENWTGFSFLKPEYYQTWADYHLRFLELMAAKNMSIWAISTGNEPLNGVIGWFFVHFMSMGWTPSNQAIWLSEHLGPTIKNSKHKDVLIFGNDDQRYTYPAWFRTMKSTRSKSLDYLDGLAVHWYWDDIFAPTLIDTAHSEMPDKLLLNTESCIGDKPWQTHGPELGSWERGEQYIRAFMQDLQHSFNGWIDWNIILDEEGGPNYVHNHVDAPVIVNATNRQEFYKQPIFYALGHFSKFLPLDSVRISTQVTNIDIDAVGFQRTDGSIAVILFNSGRVPIEISLSDSLRGNFVVNVPARSIHTFVYN